MTNIILLSYLGLCAEFVPHPLSVVSYIVTLEPLTSALVCTHYRDPNWEGLMYSAASSPSLPNLTPLALARFLVLFFPIFGGGFFIPVSTFSISFSFSLISFIC